MKLKKQEYYEERAERFYALANDTRLKILDVLYQDKYKTIEVSVGQISEILEIKQPNISQHLKILRQKGFVGKRKEGKTIFYFLSISGIRSLKLFGGKR